MGCEASALSTFCHDRHMTVVRGTFLFRCRASSFGESCEDAHRILECLRTLSSSRFPVARRRRHVRLCGRWSLATSLSTRQRQRAPRERDLRGVPEARNAADYAGFLVPHLEDDFRVLDVGCGRGTWLLETLPIPIAFDGSAASWSAPASTASSRRLSTLLRQRRSRGAFGLKRAADCSDPWNDRAARKHGLAIASDQDAMSRVWLEWSKSDAYLAFAWCRALGWKPS
jgi:hypothetical protein